MKKTIDICQKIAGAIGLIVFALVCVFALGMATPTASLQYYESERSFYSSLQSSNDLILTLGVIGLVVSGLNYFLRCNIRKKYYISNFVWSGLYIGFAIATSVCLFVIISSYQTKFMDLDFTAINDYFDANVPNQHLNSNTSVFLLGYLIASVLIVSVVPTCLVVFSKAKERLDEKKNNVNAESQKEASK